MSCSSPVNLCFTAGDDESIELTWTDDTGTAIDITGAVSNMQLRRTLYGAVEIDKAGVIATGTDGKILYTFNDTETQALLNVNEGTAYMLYDAELTLSGTTTTLVGGTITVEESVTR